MEYSTNKLSKMTGISTRTLRYYDEIDLLKPIRIASSNYRYYGQEQIDTLQQILFYRELDFSLEEIKAILYSPDFDKEKAFADHLVALQKKRERLDRLITNVTNSMLAMRGESTMTDQEKFEGFKQALIGENEQKYGTEIRAKYGEARVNESNANLIGLTQEQYDESERLRVELERTLKAAFEEGDPAGSLANEACDLHRQWLCIFYPKYTKQYHMGLAEMYVADERFKANFEKLAVGCTEFFRDAINAYCKE